MCLCAGNHLTDFQVSTSDFEPEFNVLTLADLLAVTWENILKSVCWLAVLFVVCAD